MDRLARSTPFQLQMPARPLLGRPLTLVLVSVLSIANAGIFAASIAWPFRPRAYVAPTTAIQKSNVITLSRRLKGDRLAEPNLTGEWLEQSGSRQDKSQDKNEVRPQTPDPRILLPSVPSRPRDDEDACEPVVNAWSGMPETSAELCTAAIEAYRKVAAIPHRTAGGVEGNARRHARYV